jgi:DNA invertase Pin-like site-specific DNA recombinase
MTTYVYMRRSSAPNADTRTVSFEMQEAAVRELAERHGDTIDAILSDWAKSGGTAKRSGYQELLAAIDAGTVTTVYGYSLSRLSRSLIDFADLLERCRKHKVRLRLVKEGDIDWDTASGRGFASMVAVFAQMERELAQERTQSAVDARRERGDHLGQAPYGWQVVDGQLARRTDEDPDAILAAFREAGSFGGACKLLNARKVSTRRAGTSWNHGTVADIIRQQYPKEAPVSAGRPRAKSRTGTMLGGLLRCACGSTLTPRHFDGITTYYCARSYRVPGHGKTTIREAGIMPWLQAEAARFRAPGDVVETLAADEAKRHALDAKRSRIIDLITDGTITKPEGLRRLATVDDALEALRATTALVDLPQTIDWTWEPDQVNAVLRALWAHVQLDEQLRPVRAEWTVPEWRAA